MKTKLKVQIVEVGDDFPDGDVIRIVEGGPLRVAMIKVVPDSMALEAVRRELNILVVEAIKQLEEERELHPA